MKKTIIALVGQGGKGKSSTIKLFFELLKTSYPTLKINLINRGGDITVIVEFNSIKIGIESQGDPESRLGKSLDLFVKEGCKIIVCSCRTKGEPMRTVNAISTNDNYRFMKTSNHRYRLGSTEIQNELNELSAKHLLELLETVMNLKT